MASSFLNTAGKKVTNIGNFLRDAANNNGIKYVAERATKHLIYIPYIIAEEVDEETGEKRQVKQIVAIQGDTHDWSTPDGKYRTMMCLKGIVRKNEDGTILNDGSCPFCDRVDDSWAIFNYRKKLEDETCTLVGEDRKKHMEAAAKRFAEERKMKEARTYLYVLIVKFKTDAGASLVLGADGQPEFELKVMKMSTSRVENIQKIVENTGSSFPGSELIFDYPASEDKRLIVSQSTVSVVFPDRSVLAKYPEIKAKINLAVEKFSWDSIDKAFPEWSGMTQIEAEKTTNEMFEQWDKYSKEAEVNPSARYLEYVSAPASTNPALTSGTQGVPAGQVQSAPNVPTVAPSLNGVELDAEKLFGGATPGIQI